jgi:predicted RNase H-like HicB family nuclease
MKYTVVLQQTEEGFSVGCPGLPGCWSQGATEQEALENIRAAIREYLAAVRDSLAGADPGSRGAGLNCRRSPASLTSERCEIAREGKHIVISNGVRFVTIPRNNPVHAITMGGIVRDAGLTVEEFRKLL